MLEPKNQMGVGRLVNLSALILGFFESESDESSTCLTVQESVASLSVVRNRMLPREAANYAEQKSLPLTGEEVACIQ